MGGLGGSPGRARAGRSAFTLIELLLALALLAALVSLSLPSLRRWAADATFAGASSLTETTLALVRLEAQRAGVPRTVRAEQDAEGRWLLVVRSLADGGEEDWAARAGRVAARLPSGCSVGRRAKPEAGADEVPDEAADGLGGDAGASSDAGPGRSGPIELAVFLADGSAWPSRGVLLRDRGGHAAEILVSPWSGLARVEALPPPPAEGVAQEPGGEGASGEAKPGEGE